jgi:hypothetical protein
MAGEPINDDAPLMRAAELLENAGSPPSYPPEMCQELRQRIELGLAGLPPSPVGLVVTGSDLGERAAHAFGRGGKRRVVGMSAFK